MKSKNLDEYFPNEYGSPTVYEMPVLLDWFCEGVKEITAAPKSLRPFIWFAVANGLASFSADGHVYVAGMKLTEDVPGNNRSAENQEAQ